MNQQWAPEQTIEPRDALQLIQEQFPELGADKISLLGAGWDNTAYLVNGEFIFRFPRRHLALAFVEAEWRLLPKLAGMLPLSIPVPRWKGEPGHNYPWPFLGYRMLPGSTACVANLSEKERASLAEPLAFFLKTLHATPKEFISQCPIPADNRSRIHAKVLAPKIEKNLEEMKQLGLIEKVNPVEGTYREPVATAIVHGDFYVRHLLVDGRRQLIGVIDWGDIHLGDPAIDLSIAHSFLPPEAHAVFRKAYGGVDDETWVLARVRAVYSSTLIALFGHHMGHPSLVREGLRLLIIQRGYAT